VQRHATLVITFDTRDFSATQAAADFDANAFRASAHRSLHRALHRAAEGNALLQLMPDVVSNKLSIQFGPLYFFDIDRDFAFGQMRQLITQLVNFSALLADDDAGPRGVQRHDDLLRLALDFDTRQCGVPKATVQILTDLLIFLDQFAELAAFSVPAASPRLDNAETETARMRLLTH
jgi:hypothetical protein